MMKRKATTYINTGIKRQKRLTTDENVSVVSLQHVTKCRII